MLLSHPRKSLEEHLGNTYKIGDNIFKRKRLNFDIISPKQLEELNKINLLTHDAGKAMAYFQDYIKAVQDGKEAEHSSELKDHGLISGLIAFMAAREVLKDDTMAFLSFITVSRHHNNLDNFSSYISGLRNKKVQLKQQFESIDKEGLQEIFYKYGIALEIKGLSVEKFLEVIDHMCNFKFGMMIEKTFKGIEMFLLINFLFSVLIFSDKLEAIFHSENTNLELYIKQLEEAKYLHSEKVDEYKSSLKVKSEHIAELREEAYLDVLKSVEKLNLDEKILSINLPTGAGKTLTVLKAALLMRERIAKEQGYTPRLIYILPYTSIIEQNYNVFSGVLGDTDSSVLLKHHHLSERAYKCKEGELYKEDASEHLIEAWDSEIVVSTTVQLLHSIFSNRNRQLKKFHNIANSIILLDEVQTIPHYYWKLVRDVFKEMAQHLNCYFILMTATMPLIFSEQQDEIKELAKNKRKYFAAFNRIKINASLFSKPITIDQYKEILRADIEEHKDKSFLIVMNTIKSSIEIYNYLNEIFKDEANLYYLSTNIIPKDRIERIKSIKESNGRKIIIATQMIEAGVDIDIDRVYRDFGPMDSINQVAGRCNREGAKGMGELILVKLVDSNNKRFSNYIYDYLLISSTEKVLEGIDCIEEKNISEFAVKYFEELQLHGDKGKSDRIVQMIENLSYKDAFEFTEDREKNKDVFALINNEFETCDVFIEADNYAASLWRMFEDIWGLKDKFERKKAFNNIKREFLQYVISVPKRSVMKHMEVNEIGFTHVSQSMLNNVYDKSTGFRRYEIEDYIF